MFVGSSNIQIKIGLFLCLLKGYDIVGKQNVLTYLSKLFRNYMQKHIGAVLKQIRTIQYYGISNLRTPNKSYQSL